MKSNTKNPGGNYVTWLLAKLRDPKEACFYLNAALEEQEPEIFLLVLRDVIAAQGGIKKIASKAGLSQRKLNQLLVGEESLEPGILDTISQALGLNLAFHLKDAPKKRNSSNKQKSIAKKPKKDLFHKHISNVPSVYEKMDNQSLYMKKKSS